MSGLLCLQGGGEFSPGCQEMDAQLVALAPGPVVVTALAAARGRDYATATANGVRHFRALGAAEVAGAPDAREDPAGALRVLRAAALIVLPGGSPSRLLRGLYDTGAGAVVTERFAAGALVMGASAGAMVLCSWLVQPERRRTGALPLAAGLALAPGLLVVPHWSNERDRSAWLQAAETAGEPLTVVGLREESGLLLRDGLWTAVGRAAARLVSEQRELHPSETWRPG